MSSADVSYTKWIEYPRAQLRFILTTRRNTTTQFLVQLEYRLEEEWTPVVRFDHNPANQDGHDITEEGLHMDIYREGEKVRVKRDFPTVPLSAAPQYCKTYIENNAEPLLRRFEQWHDLKTTR